MPYKVVTDFENRIADFSGAKYAVAVESCTAAIFLSCFYKRVKDVFIPKRTYPSVPCSIIHAGGRVHFTDQAWSGTYELAPYGIVDGALRFRRDMYKGGLHCLSFHIKKLLPIGRGGMILTDDEQAAHMVQTGTVRRQKSYTAGAGQLHYARLEHVSLSRPSSAWYSVV